MFSRFARRLPTIPPRARHNLAVRPGMTALRLTTSANANPDPGSSSAATKPRVAGGIQSHTFKAETKQLLDIVANSLYTDKEVFLRELVSNASDAMEKSRLLRLTEAGTENQRPLEIMITGDDSQGTLTIVDTGVGMTYHEMVDNLGTICRSGSKAFLEQLKTTADSSSIIGKFGVGFYSAFMVADKVEVYSRAEASSSAHYWSSDGTGSYDIAEAEGVTVGTKVVLHLKKDCRKFAKDDEIRRIIGKHSSCVGFPVTVNGKVQESLGAIWLRNKKDLTKTEYHDFYKQLTHAYEDPMDILHFTTDVPLSLHALIYLPKRHTEKFGMGKEKPGVNLYSRKVVIQPNSVHLLPDWLRFIKGAVDSSDIPLNISRESMQNSALIRRINNVLTQRVIRHLADMAKHDTDKYEIFFAEFGQFLKEGICTDETNRSRIAPLLRFASSNGDQVTSLDEYVGRMASTQKEIYYFCNPSRDLALSSPYYEAFKDRNVEVLFLYREVDDFVMQSLRRHADRALVSIETAKNVFRSSSSTKSEDGIAANQEDDSPEIKLIKDSMPSYLKSVLGKRVSGVTISKRLVTSPAILIDHENAAIRRMMKMVEGGKTMVDSLSQQKMEINPAHSIIRGIHAARDSNPDLAAKLSEQIFDNALVAAGLMDDPRSMLGRINDLMEVCLSTANVHPAPSATPRCDRHIEAEILTSSDSVAQKLE